MDGTSIKIPNSPVIEQSRYSPWPYAVFISIFTGILFFAVSLNPAPQGVGTHEQLGLPPCGFLLVTGFPCPACGLTTSIAHIGHGEIWEAVKVQPFGAVLFVVLLGMSVFSFFGLVRKSPFSEFSESIFFEWLQYFLLIAFMLSWAYKVYIMKFLSAFTH